MQGQNFSTWRGRTDHTSSSQPLQNRESKAPQSHPTPSTPNFKAKATRSRALEETSCAFSALPAPLAKSSKPGTSGREDCSKEQGAPYTCAERAHTLGEGAGNRVGLPPPSSLPRRGRDYPPHQSEVGADPCASRKPQESSLRPSRKKNPSNLNSSPASDRRSWEECHPINNRAGKKGASPSQWKTR